VLELVGEGMLNKEIATQLGVSKSHVEKYVKRLLDKTNTSNRTELVRRALQTGLLSDEVVTSTQLNADMLRTRVLLQPGSDSDGSSTDPRMPKGSG